MTKKPIRLIALDLDDTTLLSNGTLAPETEAAIRRAISDGIEVVVASGRAYSSLPDSVTGIRGLRYAVTSNGSAVNINPGGERIHCTTVPEEAVRSILRRLENYPELAVEGFLAGTPYSARAYIEDPVKFGSEERISGYIRRTRTPVEDIRTFLWEHAGELDSLDVVCSDPPRRAQLQELIRATAPEVYFTTSAAHLIEIANRDAGKGAGVRYLCDLLQVPYDQTAACGNADNDIDMIRFAGIGGAVANASPNCLAAADVILKSNDELGVAWLIHEICDGMEW